MTSHRQERISELLHEELGILISAELTDPRLEDAMVSVTSVVVSPDLRSARVFIEHALPPKASPEVLAALQHAEGFLRQALAENLNLRFVPELSFKIDLTSTRASRIDALLDTVVAANQRISESANQRINGSSHSPFAHSPFAHSSFPRPTETSPQGEDEQE